MMKMHGETSVFASAANYSPFIGPAACAVPDIIKYFIFSSAAYGFQIAITPHDLHDFSFASATCHIYLVLYWADHELCT